MAKKAMVYIQSGGPTSVINSSLYGAIREAEAHKDQISHVYGSLHGIEGLLCDELIDLGQEDFETIELLKQTPGSIHVINFQRIIMMMNIKPSSLPCKNITLVMSLLMVEMTPWIHALN